MRKILSAIVAFIIAAAIPLVPLVFAGEPDCSTGECLLPSEAAILFYPLSAAIGAVVGMPVYWAVHWIMFWRRLVLTGLVVGAVGFVLSLFTTQGGNRFELLWLLPMGLVSALVFGAMYRIGMGKSVRS